MVETGSYGGGQVGGVSWASGQVGMQRPGEREGDGRVYYLVRFVRRVHPQTSTQPRVHIPITPKSLGPLRSLPPPPLPSPFPPAGTHWPALAPLHSFAFPRILHE